MDRPSPVAVPSRVGPFVCRLLGTAVLLAELGSLTGCSLFGSSATSPGSDIRQTAAIEDDEPEIKDNRRFLERSFRSGQRNRRNSVAQTREWMTLGRDEFERGQQLYKAGQHEQAIEVLEPLVKKDRYRDAFVREEAIYTLAEAEFAAGRYPQSDDHWHQLFAEFPNTRYRNAATKRLMAIARDWLKLQDITPTSAIQPVNYENIPKTPDPTDDRSLPLTTRFPIIPNMFDGSRPAFDTPGRGLKALRTIWLQDPTGPLADDALMFTASYYYRLGRYEEADQYYTILRDEYPQSPHVENAFVMGGHVKLMSYQGSKYDDEPLKSAEALNKSTLRLFPESADADRIRQELDRLQDVKAAREWETVKLYQRKGRPKAVAVTSALLISRYPQTQYASLAREALADLEPEVLREAGVPTNFGGRAAPVSRPMPRPRTFDNEPPVRNRGPYETSPNETAPSPRTPPRIFDPEPGFTPIGESR